MFYLRWYARQTELQDLKKQAKLILGCVNKTDKNLRNQSTPVGADEV